MVYYNVCMNRSRRYLIRKPKQLSALVSAVRQEIADILGERGPASVAEIATTLGRPADALYFHLRAMMRAGLVRQAGYRKRGRHKEALYQTAGELMLAYEPRSTGNRRGIQAIVSSMMRLGIRDFGRALRHTDVNVSGPRRELWALRKTGRMPPAQVADVNQLIERLSHTVSRPSGHGRLYAITILLTPLDHSRRANKPGKKTPGEKKR